MTRPVEPLYFAIKGRLWRSLRDSQCAMAIRLAEMSLRLEASMAGLLDSLDRRRNHE